MTVSFIDNLSLMAVTKYAHQHSKDQVIEDEFSRFFSSDRKDDSDSTLSLNSDRLLEGVSEITRYQSSVTADSIKNQAEVIRVRNPDSVSLENNIASLSKVDASKLSSDGALKLFKGAQAESVPSSLISKYPVGYLFGIYSHNIKFTVEKNGALLLNLPDKSDVIHFSDFTDSNNKVYSNSKGDFRNDKALASIPANNSIKGRTIIEQPLYQRTNLFVSREKIPKTKVTLVDCHGNKAFYFRDYRLNIMEVISRFGPAINVIKSCYGSSKIFGNGVKLN